MADTETTDNSSSAPHRQSGNRVDLSSFNNDWFQRGRPKIVELLWMIIQALFVSSWFPGAAHRRFFFKLFGAKIGKGVDIKPGVRVKFPWRLTIGDYAWIGENSWIDNLADVSIGPHACVSQGVYLCTGSHDWSKTTFDLIVEPITIEEAAWICSSAVIGPGVTAKEGSVLSIGSTATSDLEPWTVYAGHPAEAIKTRVLKPSVD